MTKLASDACSVSNFEVADQIRGQGLGRKMMGRAMFHAWNGGVRWFFSHWAGESLSQDAEQVLTTLRRRGYPVRRVEVPGVDQTTREHAGEAAYLLDLWEVFGPSHGL